MPDGLEGAKRTERTERTEGTLAKEVADGDEPSAVIGLQLANNRMSIRPSKQARNSIAAGDRRHHSHQQPH